jgi:hypothetical protein
MLMQYNNNKIINNQLNRPKKRILLSEGKVVVDKVIQKIMRGNL